MASFVSRRPQNTFFLPISLKKKKDKIVTFDQKSWTNPFKKCKIFVSLVLNRFFYSLKWPVLYLQDHKTLSLKYNNKVQIFLL